MGRILVARGVAPVLSLALAISVAAGISGCSGRTDDGRPTVKIGVHTTLTGGLANFGSAMVGALELAAEDLSGFEIDGVSYEIELVILDDQGDPSQAPVVAANLVDAGVVGVIGPLTSGSTNAALPIYEPAGVPVISGSATMADITEAGFENFFRTCLRDDLQGKALAEWAVELGFGKVVVMDDQSDYAVGLGNEVQTGLEASNVEVLRLRTQEGDVDFSAQTEGIRSFEPDAVIYTGYHREAGLLRKQLVEAGLGGIRFMGGDGIRSDEIADDAGGSANARDLLCTFGGFSSLQMPGYADFAVRFNEATGVDPGPYAENNYDALGALVQAMVAAQSTEGADVIAALFDVEHDGVMGVLRFDDKGDLTTPDDVGTGLIPRFRFDGETWVLLQ
jgi:branched-chain amino acid transport system substrate-binding protein